MLRDVVRQLRKARGWSQAELGRRAGITEDSVANIERGRSKHSTTPTLEGIAKAFDMTLAELMAYIAGAGAMPEPVNQLRIEGYPAEALVRLSEMWGDLTDEDRERVVQVTRSIWEGRVAQRRQVGEVPNNPEHI